MVKEKPNSTRLYDSDGFRKRAACVCVKNEQEAEVLLVTSSRHTDQWIVPGGGLEPEEEADAAAAREVIEEAGVRGNICRCLGSFQNDDRKHRTVVYVLVVTEELPEWEDSKNIGRKRKWFKLDEASKHLAHRPLQLNYLQLLRPHNKRNLETEKRPT
ncbi:diphosphoinositol polyphosphate phosphohydrolase 1 isoform X3 [Folsomia candida]|uniref:diphosphoinositol-polyphosphate diphosphatase n=1 Tax=Folsomia candida TaxID=158441 RepID=A0A226EZF9_FOLCA|nr:diphosphoinositol polyphosphate phosphohydrolase 1 isoform X3 [Folsomia candida]XP_021949020.1 diphosphoinositol polyphosphate phosphohydrolase 1 isoform X3 [Folsomia candida]XP_035702485.1 diphosphoinositol polyphosphate phosphohydrolase 1 isoform X3 [Folsomia candida]OXA62955.1 Diphosphoinositol polyphosphate phosphohydrolase 1 [Folsomia candida]